MPLDVLWESRLEREQLRTLADRLHEARTRDEQLVHVNQFLLSRTGSAGAPADAVEQALSTICLTHGQVRVEALASSLGVTSRHLERGFRRHVGLSPKALCRLARFHHVRSLLARASRPVWAHLACECGYYDQAHLIRDFRHFTGQTPTIYSTDQEVGFFLYGRERQP
jgi:transcriptional regulator GlxA family with amidase domain